MGESGSKPGKQPFLENFRQAYTLLQEGYDDPRLGRVNVYKGQGGHIAVKKSYTYNREDIDSFLQDNLNQALNTYPNCPYILKLVAYDEIDDQSMCGSVGEVQSYHEYHLNNLEAEVQQRNRNLLFYSESELWVILYSIISASSFLEKYKKSINDIRPQNIYITVNGQLKLVPYGLFPDDFPSYNKVQSYGHQCYLSPEQLVELKKKELKSGSNVFKADMFATGITLLQCASLQSGIDCFDYDNQQLRNDIIEGMIASASNKYSKFFVNMIRLLLEESADKRPLPSAVAQILLPYENQILNLMPFSPDYNVVRQSLYTYAPTTTGLAQSSPDRSNQVLISTPDGKKQLVRQSVTSTQNEGNIITQQPIQTFTTQQNQSPVQAQRVAQQLPQQQQYTISGYNPQYQVYDNQNVIQQQQFPLLENNQYSNRLVEVPQVLQQDDKGNLPAGQLGYPQQVQYLVSQQDETYPSQIPQSPIRLIQGPIPNYSQNNIPQQGYLQQSPQQVVSQQQLLQIPQPINQQNPLTQNHGYSFSVNPQYQLQGNQSQISSEKVSLQNNIQTAKFPTQQQQYLPQLAQQQIYYPQNYYPFQQPAPQLQQQQQQQQQQNTGIQQQQNQKKVNQIVSNYDRYTNTFPNASELSDIDRRINEVLNKTRTTLERVEQSERQE